jgi:enoyl-CoA hydratase
MILRAKRISGPEALRIGLVHEVWPKEELKERAHSLAQELASGPSIAIGGVLRAVVGSADKTLDEALAAEREAVMRTMGTRDQAEGMRAFMEKRKPNFKGE